MLGRAGRYTEVPGYLTLDQFRKRNGRVLPKSHGAFDWDEISKLFRVAAGTPATVAEKIERWAEETGSNRIILNCHAGNMPHWAVVRSLTLLAEEVIPMLRGRAKTVRLAAE